jgi:hypothetical protein
MSPSAKSSFQFALQRELLKLYLVIVAGLAILTVTDGAFHIIAEPRLRDLVRFPFTVLGWGVIVGGVVGVLHFVVTQTTGHAVQ